MMPMPATSVSANDVLSTADADAKAVAGRAFRRNVEGGQFDFKAFAPPALTPARPLRPELVPPSGVAKRGLGTAAGRAALLHAIAHIELNAIDLSADMIARFANAEELESERDRFVDDWSKVCDDESRHFAMIQARLRELGHAYGDFPAHNGLWDAARDTAHDIAARLAIAPLVLEARGLDVTPGMIKRLESVGDKASAEILKVIYREEVAHVETGIRWFRHVAKARNQRPVPYFQNLVKDHFRGRLKPPFNVEARDRAHFPIDFYGKLAS
jgi:uncharacterized ferritin-like protein (DUF455 family)